MQRSKLRSGLMLAILLPLIGCVATPSASGVVPDYAPAFLECVADEYDNSTYGDCTRRAIDDWSVIIDDMD